MNGFPVTKRKKNKNVIKIQGMKIKFLSVKRCIRLSEIRNEGMRKVINIYPINVQD